MARRRTRKQATIETFHTVLISFGVYFSTVTGVLFSEYIPLLQNSLEIPLEALIPSVPKVIGACVVGVIVTFFAELKEQDKIGNLRHRLVKFFLYGIAWSQILELVLGG